MTMSQCLISGHAGYRNYTAFGLSIRSELELSGLEEQADVSVPGVPDVTIVNGKVPESLDNPVQAFRAFQAKPGQFLFSLKGVARYLVTDGREITVERMPGKSDGEVGVHLLCSVFGAMFHQRGLLPLHASAVKVGERCALFTGTSGAGKSTTAAALLKRGYELHADDLCVVWNSRKSEEGLPLVYPAFPQMKLWKDTMESEGLDCAEHAKLLADREKYLVQRRDRFNRKPLPIGKVYVLCKDSSEEIAMEEIRGMEKFKTLVECTYRVEYLEGLGKRREHFENLAAAFGRVPVAYIKRPRDFARLDELADFIVADFSKWNA